MDRKSMCNVTGVTHSDDTTDKNYQLCSSPQLYGECDSISAHCFFLFFVATSLIQLGI